MTKKRVAATSPQSLPTGFTELLGDVKRRIQTAQTRAMASVNAELIRLYWDIGRMIQERQQREGWGTAVIPRLAAELRNELPEVKDFSERNIKRMLAFHREYPNTKPIVPQAAAQLPSSRKAKQVAATVMDSTFWSIPWFHHVILIEKSQRPWRSPLVHGTNAGQRLEPKRTHDDDRYPGSPPSRESRHQLYWPAS
jgi:hypothetical protein